MGHMKQIHFICDCLSGIYGGERFMKVAVTCLLPKRVYGGWEGGVLWYDLDGHFDMLCIVCLL